MKENVSTKSTCSTYIANIFQRLKIGNMSSMKYTILT